RVAAATRPVDHERLEGLSARVAGAGHAPRREHLVLVARPRAGQRDTGARLGEPLGLAGGLPLVAPVLFAVAVRVSSSQRETAAQRFRAVRACDVEAAQPSSVVAEPP